MSSPETPADLSRTGPFVGIAVLCEKVIQEPEGPFSVIRVTDTINQAAVGPDAPREMAPFMATPTLVIMLKAGQAQGSFDISVRPEAPGGFQLPTLEQRVHMQSGPWGAMLVIPLQ